MYAAMTEAAQAENIVCPAVRTVLTTGSKLSPQIRRDLAALFPSAVVHEYYGASELSFVAVAKDGEGCPETAVGRPFRGVEVTVRRGDGEPAEAGAIGRLDVRSPMLCGGYLQPGDDVTGFRVENGWATVGDQGWRDDAGFLHLAGREGGMLISGGVNVYPAEVEAALNALPEIEEAVVFGLPDAYWGDAVCAVIRWRPDHALSRDELKARVCQRLSAAKCPQRFFASRVLPLTPSGKVALRQLQAEVQASPPLHDEIW
jgi:acyl-CoA synthetase (AMP-forming)/AMP-acid ligase II